MIQGSNRWGIELNGLEADQNVWRRLLKTPHDPFVEEVTNERDGKFLALRSSLFNGLTTSEEVHRAAKQLFNTLNGVMSMNADTDPVSNGAVIEFLPDGQTRKARHLETETSTMSLRGGITEMTVKDTHGNVIEPPPSRAQLWMRAADLVPKIGIALRYLNGKPGWVELYKAYEAVLVVLPKRSDISKNQITRFTRNADFEARHYPDPEKKPPPPNPMELWEGRAFITQWVSDAIEDVLKNRLNP